MYLCLQKCPWCSSNQFLAKSGCWIPSRWDYPFSVWEEHHCLRQKFLRSLPAPGEVTRPWIWPSGDNDDHTEREWPSEPPSPPPDHAGARPAPVEAASSSSGQPIEGRSHTCISVADGRFRLLSDHGKAMGEDEIKFHLRSPGRSAHPRFHWCFPTQTNCAEL